MTQVKVRIFLLVLFGVLNRCDSREKLERVKHEKLASRVGKPPCDRSYLTLLAKLTIFYNPPHLSHIIITISNRTSYVSKPILKRVLDSLLDPIPADQVEHLLRYSRWGEDGSVDYNDFLEKYAGE